MSRWNQSVENIDLMLGQMSMMLRAVLMEFQIGSDKRSSRNVQFRVNKIRQFLIIS